ncbi:tyrosine-protein kinase domain-containing protein [Zavarzinella formosa]|uniref:tyrosine-protein kinase domain-containing protein n=1 Tax=Zavarzinella formosa TaxID=360055 RepID=UPI0002D57386|nr:tyrosine-protein kinase domain-containing protein [Zavarzinella formosa]
MTPTTLPATRLPDFIPDAIPVEADSPRVYSVPSRMPEAPPAEPAGGGGMKPLEYLRYRWMTVLFLGGLLGGGLGMAAYSTIPAKYTTYSIIRVSPQDPRIYYNEDPQGRSDFASYLKTQAGMLRSHFVLNAAIRDPEIAALPMLREQPDPVRFLEEELVIDLQDGGELIKPKLSGDDPKAITMVVNSIHDAFFREIVEAERTRKQARLTSMETAIGKMQTDLEKQSANPKDQAGDPKPAESLPGVGPTLAASQLTRLREKLDSVDIRRKQIEAEKIRLAKRLENVDAEIPAPGPGYVASLDNDMAIASITRQLTQWQKQLNFQLELNSDPNNKGIAELRQKIADQTAEREKMKKARVEEYRESMRDDTVRRLNSEGEKMDAELVGAKIVHEKTTAEISEYEAKLASILPLGEGGVKDFTKVDSTSRAAIISGMMEKTNLLRLELAAPSRVQSFQKAAAPMKKDIKKQLIGTAGGVLAGFLLVGFGVVAYESRVKRAMSLADVQKATLGPILGAIPTVNPTADQPTPELALAEEAIEKARANLMHQFGRGGGKVILVTSAVTDDGHSFMSRELALSFARAGARTILVDFDLRSPTLHDLFEVSNESGFTEFLAGTADLPTAAKVTPYGMAILPAGPWTDHVRQHLSADKLAMRLGQLRDQFDAVIVNAHPVLSVAETALAGRSADAVVLTVERYESRLAHVSRAQEKIASLMPDAFGVVFLGATRDECLQ